MLKDEEKSVARSNGFLFASLWLHRALLGVSCFWDTFTSIVLSFSLRYLISRILHASQEAVYLYLAIFLNDGFVRIHT